MLNTHFARRWRFVLPLSLILLTAPLASGAIVLESKGWRVTLPTWVARAGGVVVEDPAPDDVLLIQIVKIFRGDAGGVGDMPSVVASFTQIAPDDETATQIVINDESVTNDTSEDWVDYHFILAGLGYASYDQQATFPGVPGQDFYLDQFSQYEWGLEKPDPNDPTTWVESLNLSDGVVPQGDAFNPGSLSGALYINVDLDFDGDSTNAFFAFKEYPTIPEPLSASLLLLGGVGLVRRRRR